MLSDPTGTRLGKYQLLRRLATGGMAEIFLARAQAIHGFEKQVVLKRILPQHAQSDDFIRMSSGHAEGGPGNDRLEVETRIDADVAWHEFNDKQKYNSGLDYLWCECDIAVVLMLLS